MLLCHLLFKTSSFLSLFIFSLFLICSSCKKVFEDRCFYLFCLFYVWLNKWKQVQHAANNIRESSPSKTHNSYQLFYELMLLKRLHGLFILFIYPLSDWRTTVWNVCKPEKCVKKVVFKYVMSSALVKGKNIFNGKRIDHFGRHKKCWFRRTACFSY